MKSETIRRVLAAQREEVERWHDNRPTNYPNARPPRELPTAILTRCAQWLPVTGRITAVTAAIASPVEIQVEEQQGVYAERHVIHRSSFVLDPEDIIALRFSDGSALGEEIST